jgi:ribonuclease Z
MILEGMYGAEEDLPKALKNHHMLFREAAQLALEAGTRRLLLTHFSTSLEDPAAFLPEARRIFPDTACAADGMTLSLGWPEAT